MPLKLDSSEAAPSFVQLKIHFRRCSLLVHAFVSCSIRHGWWGGCSGTFTLTAVVEITADVHVVGGWSWVESGFTVYSKVLQGGKDLNDHGFKFGYLGCVVGEFCFVFGAKDLNLAPGTCVSFARSQYRCGKGGGGGGCSAWNRSRFNGRDGLAVALDDV